MVYVEILAKGKQRFFYLKLDQSLLMSSRRDDALRNNALYYDVRGNLTPVARYIALYLLGKGVPESAIRVHFKVTELELCRLQIERVRAARVFQHQDEDDLLRLVALNKDGEV